MTSVPKFIAEVSSNHNRDLDRCLQFVEESARVGCDAVKFQLFRIDDLFAPEILKKSVEHSARREWELPLEFVPHIAERCREVGLEFACTPFYLDAVAELRSHVSFYKIASYELPWADLLESCARTRLPVVLSTGMATLDEVQEAVAVLREGGCEDLTLLHCVSRYPALPEVCNLAAIETLRETCECPVGWSDHSVSPAVIHRAVNRFGATMVEFHLDLDGVGNEFESKHCWLPDEIEPVIRATKRGFVADGNGRKEPHADEEEERSWRADPSDGLRPVLSVRERWKET